MKPPFSYYGGKQRMVRNIVPLIPKHTVYVEPFCGGATIMFAKPWPDVSNSHDYREVINDKNGRVVNFFNVLRDDGEELCRILSFQLYSQSEYHKAVKCDKTDRMENAVSFFVEINMSFSNKENGGWGTAVKTTNHPVSWFKKVDRLEDYIARMRGVYVENIDAVDCIKKWDSPQTFFYCDPPYVGTDQGHYKGYSATDLDLLVETLGSIEGQFLLSSYDNEYINAPFPKLNFSATNSSAKNKREKRTETVWYKYNDSFEDYAQKLFDSGKFDCFTGGTHERQTRLF